MTEQTDYFKHLAGTTAFLGWCRRWSQIPNGLGFHAQVVQLGAVPAQRFGVAWPKKKRYAKGPSLLYQTTEGQWMESIRWSRASVENGPDGSALLLVSRLVPGDETRFMNIPAFALRIPISIEQGRLWEELGCSKVGLRPLWQDEEVHVGPSYVELPLTFITPRHSVFKDHEIEQGLPFHEMLERRLRETGVDTNPGFRGSAETVIQDPYLKSQVEYRQGLQPGALSPGKTGVE